MKLIVAFSKNLGIGYKNKLPWHFKKDLKYFKKITVGNNNNAVIMGKNTFKSLPNGLLKKRTNLVLSSSLKGENIFNSLQELNIHLKKKKYDDIWVIGGQQIYNLFLENNSIEYIYTTEFAKNYNCDTFFPNIKNINFKEIYSSNINSENNIEFYHKIYKNNNFY